MKHPKYISDGFFMLPRGLEALLKTPGVAWLLIIPVLVNLALFIGFAFLFWVKLAPGLRGFIHMAQDQAGVFIAIVGWLFVIMLFLLILVIYAFVFSIIAEVIGAPFYEEIGARIDKQAKQVIVERPWYKEVWLAVTQESVKLLLLGVVILFGFTLQFLPGVGQLVSVLFGFGVLVMTSGADAVGPALARRGLLLGDRRKWVIKHLLPVLGLGAAKALGLIVPVFNIVVLPMAAAGGTLLVQKYDK